MTALPWLRDDGGRAAAGYRGDAGDCVVRAVAIAARLPYQDVYDALAAANREAASRARKLRHGSPRDGTHKHVSRDYLAALGAVWTPTMQIGSGCQVHLAAGEVPAEGRYVVKLSKHLSALVDGVVHDTYDPGRDGTRCVYGWWEFPA